MIDTHCHLNYPPIDTDIEAVLARAHEAGVKGFVLPGTDAETSFSGVNLARRYANVYPAVGIHPEQADKLEEDDNAKVRELAELNTVVAIGEVGLDYFHFETTDEKEIARLKLKQKALFTDMIELAQEVQKPLIIHSRDCFEDIYAQLSTQVPNHPTVIHCFTGTMEEAKMWLDLGYMLSFTGIITYKKNDALREVVKMTPLEQMMIETDAPYLAPEGFRGQICEPKYVRNVAECIAEVKGITFAEVDEVTTETAIDFFSLPS